MEKCVEGLNKWVEGRKGVCSVAKVCGGRKNVWWLVRDQTPNMNICISAPFEG